MYSFKILFKNIYYFFFHSFLIKKYIKWKNITKNLKFSDNKKKNKKILIATSTGGHQIALSIEILLGLGLKARDCNVEYALCDQTLSICSDCTFFEFNDEKKFYKFGHKSRCITCWYNGKVSLNDANLDLIKFSDFLKKKDISEIDKILKNTKVNQIKNFKINDVSIGEHSLAGALRFFAKGVLKDSKFENYILLKNFKSALETYFIFKRVFENIRYDVIVLNHGVYVPQGIIAEIAKSYGIKVVTWFATYRKKCVLFSWNETYHKSLLKEPNEDWENIVFDQNSKEKLRNYLKSKVSGSQDWIYFSDKKNINSFDFKKYLNSTFKGEDEFVSLFTNVIWDAQLYFDQNIFDNIIDWVIKTIKFFIKKNKILVIRAHPAEVKGSLPSRQKIYDEIFKYFGEIPKNIIFIHPEDNISSYSIIENSKFCIVYGSTIGIEIPALGKNVVVGGESWIKNKGISFDPKTQKEYFDILERLINTKNLSISSEIKEKAEKYAYHFFFRRMIPINILNTDKKDQLLDIRQCNVDMIYPGTKKDPGLNAICEAIINYNNFIYD